MAALALVNGKVYSTRADRPFVEAVALDGGRIKAVGTSREIRDRFSGEAETIDLEGRLVLPGFTDSHIHFLDWALVRKQIDVAGSKSQAEVLEAVHAAAGATPPGEWIISWGLDESGWPERRLPTRFDLDLIAPANPVFLRRKDGHMAVVNSPALSEAGLDEDAKDPSDGVLVRDESGRMNGLLKESGVDLVARAIPKPGTNEIIQAATEAIPAAHAMGLTGIHDMRIPEDDSSPLKIWRELEQSGALKLRCWACLPGSMRRQATDLGLNSGFGGDRLRVGHLKYFLDGSIGSGTAWMRDPYPDGSYGLAVTSPGELAHEIRQAGLAGFAVAVHAIGDRANQELVNIFNGLSEKLKSGVRHRLEHAQIMRPRQIAELAEASIVASVQPLHITDEMAIHEQRFGARSKWAYRFGEMIERGVITIFGSDCPVSSPNPLLGIHAAVNRKTADGAPPGGWYPDQRVGVEEAIRAYTINPAVSCGLENQLGSISPGKFADLIVLNQDLFQVNPEAICETRVDLTIFQGRVVFQR